MKDSYDELIASIWIAVVIVIVSAGIVQVGVDVITYRSAKKCAESQTSP